MTALHWHPAGNFDMKNISPDKLAEYLEFQCDRIMTDYIYTTASGDKGFFRENVLAMMKRNFGDYV
jgi:hypothetical protein